MKRNTAIAAAIAVTMSLTSGVVALGANAGALGFGRATPSAATQRVVPSTTPSAQPTASSTASQEREYEDGALSAQIGAKSAETTRGEQ